MSLAVFRLLEFAKTAFKKRHLLGALFFEPRTSRQSKGHDSPDDEGFFELLQMSLALEVTSRRVSARRRQRDEGEPRSPLSFSVIRYSEGFKLRHSFDYR
jgi:hypothetical protein